MQAAFDTGVRAVLYAYRTCVVFLSNLCRVLIEPVSCPYRTCVVSLSNLCRVLIEPVVV
uniref:Uncharacterized protein n=1 Tax=Anguilla anguilla TaxID=7936 RepID=A0A0E9SFB4_ANGAN